MTYEGARSILGPYLSFLGASGAIVGTAVGFAEFVGFGLRFISGYVTEKTQKFWPITFVGYVINLIAIPLLAFVGSWKAAVFLIILERFGKAIRVPARDAMLSFATKQTGRGWGFGIHEAMDRTGALLGPLLMAFVLFFQGNYKIGFLLLSIPAALALASLTLARYAYPKPQAFEVQTRTLQARGFSGAFWLYILAVGLVGCGYVDFALIAFHFQKSSILPEVWIPLFYTIAMAVDGGAALLMGKLFDRFGLIVILIVTALSALFAPLVFFGDFTLALIGIILWGIGLCAQQSVMRAAVALLVPAVRRPSAYGTLNFAYGLLWFLGSALMGLLYDISPLYLVLFSLITQFTSIPVFLIIIKRIK